MLSPPASWLGEVAVLAVPRQVECDPRTLPLLGPQAQVVEGGDSFAAALQLTRVRELGDCPRGGALGGPVAREA